jgi:hypothetical protein
MAEQGRGMATLTWNSEIRVAREQVSCDLGGDLVILDLQGGIYYGLSDVGARVWELLQERRSLGEIREQLLLEYDVEPERCERDLLALVSELAQRSLIEVQDASAA